MIFIFRPVNIVNAGFIIKLNIYKNTKIKSYIIYTYKTLKFIKNRLAKGTFL